MEEKQKNSEHLKRLAKALKYIIKCDKEMEEKIEKTELTYSFKVIVPNDFKGVKPYGKIQTIDNFISHWIDEGYYLEDGYLELPNGLEVKERGFDAFPEDWWKELIPEKQWKHELPKLNKCNLILKKQ